MDELWEEYNKNKSNPKKLEQLYDKIGRIKVFDPACGSGNFLIVSYRELRLLEYEILKTLREEGQSSLTHYFAGDITRIKIKNFYGIEIEEFPSKIAQVSMWIVEHQMNQKYKRKFNIDQADLPLKSSVNIYNINALQTDWKEILEPTDDVYVLGNPPFAGKEQQTKLQKQDLKEVFKGFKRIGNLDYVTCWYKKAAEYIQETKIECAFVSTNSICQGEQSLILWKILMEDYGLCINFAHQSFKWGNEVKKKAGVFVIIVGFSLMERKNKELFSYEKPDALPIKREARDINHYLFDFKCPFIKRENNPRYPDVVKCQKGCKPNDGGNFIIKDDELDEFLDNEPKAEKFIHPFIASSEFINGKNRYCLWIKDAKPSEIKEMLLVHERINNIHKLRSRSKDKRTRKLADYPTEFDTSNNPETDFIMIPETSSENRRYIPIGFMNKNIIPSSACFWIGSDDKYLFGMITSKMHMTWMKYVGGRLKGDFRYNSSLVYHTFPFPETTESNKNKIRKQVDEILKIREEIGDTYKDMYDPDLMPSKLLKAHQQLDTLVDKCYQNKPFRNDEERMKLLFDLYSNYVDS